MKCCTEVEKYPETKTSIDSSEIARVKSSAALMAITAFDFVPLASEEIFSDTLAGIGSYSVPAVMTDADRQIASNYSVTTVAPVFGY